MSAAARTAATAALVALLAGCGGASQEKLAALDNRVLCTLGGQAFVLRHGGGAIFYAYRMPEMDSACALPR